MTMKKMKPFPGRAMREAENVDSVDDLPFCLKRSEGAFSSETQ